ncbi:glycosyl transferase [Longimycelium tulufanense]|uniref:Glycosyl transferase n=1 Tax=Longimycelium tulufanense TaxID=907463 RepID=A0A8J3CDC6_9PSEU|nr:glycosyltransferase family 2 protein [Longimycelium tulufanense]GGM50858.1 glycosyl transferase [Longimycelium tulufanense]
MTPVLVAVVTHQSMAELPGLFSGLPEALRGIDRWRVVIADNASTDGGPEWAARALPEATVVATGGNLGYAAGINAAMATAEPDETVLVLNPDVRLAPGSVRTLLSALDDEAVGVAVPEVTRPDGTPEPTLRRRPSVARAWGEALLGSRAQRFPALSERMPVDAGQRDVDWANGAVLLIAPTVRRVIGPWREDLFLYSEEVDYCRRVQDAGWQIRQVPGASVVHRGGAVTRNPALWAQMVTNRVVHAARWDGTRAAWGTWAAFVVAQLLRLPLRRGTHRAALAALWRGRRRLLAGEPTNPAAPASFRAAVGVSTVGGGRR